MWATPEPKAATSPFRIPSFEVRVQQNQRRSAGSTSDAIDAIDAQASQTGTEIAALDTGVELSVCRCAAAPTASSAHTKYGFSQALPNT